MIQFTWYSPTVMPYGASLSAAIAFDNKASSKVVASDLWCCDAMLITQVKSDSDLADQVQRLAVLVDKLSGSVKVRLFALNAIVLTMSSSTCRRRRPRLRPSRTGLQRLSTMCVVDIRSTAFLVRRKLVVAEV
jgi:hypothetical protein